MTRKISISKAFAFVAVLCLPLLSASRTAAQDYPIVELGELDDAVSRNIRNHLSLASESCQLSQRRLRTLSDSFDEKISRALRALGYYQSSWNKQIESTDQCWKLVLEMELGEPVIITAVDIDLLGAISEDPEILNILNTATPQIGSRLIHSTYESFKRTLHNTALSRGYAESRFVTQQLLVDPQTNSAQVLLAFEGGQRYSFGAVSFVSEDFDSAFLAKYQPFAQGDPFNSRLLTEFQERLINSRLFADVGVIDQDEDASLKQIPIEVSAVSISKHVSAVGIGIATDTGPRASFSYDNNRANTTGHQYSADASVSTIESSFNFGYRIPLSRPSSEQARFNLGWLNEDTGTSENEIWFVGLAHSAETETNWLRTIDLTYQVESYLVGSDQDSTGLLIPSINWHRSRANDLSYPTSGLRLQGGIRGSVEGAGSDLSFLQLTGSVKYIHQLGKGRFLTRFEAGVTLVDETSILPASLRYFAGGDSSVRGFDYKSLGPIDIDGEITGGKHLLTASIEYEHPVSSKYGVAFFYDAGNAFDDTEFDIADSIGIGGRWRSPIGQIRIDLAFPQNSEDSFRLHLSMGPDL